jgi:hypothetical protein
MLWGFDFFQVDPLPLWQEFNDQIYQIPVTIKRVKNLNVILGVFIWGIWGTFFGSPSPYIMDQENQNFRTFNFAPEKR